MKVASRILILVISIASVVFWLSSCAIPLVEIPLPVFSPSTGSFSSDMVVTITDATAGVSIYYTTDGTTPTASSSAYATPVAVAGNGTTMTLKAMAEKTGMTGSATASATYTIDYSRVSTPQLSPTSGTYGSGQLVTIYDSTPGSAIHYTVDGTLPSASSAVYGAPILVTWDGGTRTIKAIGTRSGLGDSTIASATYLINTPLIAAQWAKSANPAFSNSVFNSVAVDSSQSSYAAGSIQGTGAYGFGNSVNATAAVNTVANLVLVKYNSIGSAQWAATIVSGPVLGTSQFDAAAVDSQGNVYAAGVMTVAGTYDFGNTVTAITPLAGSNVVIAKFDHDGTAQWAKTFVAGTLGSNGTYYGVAVDSSGNVYAAGTITGTLSYAFGNSVTAVGTAAGTNLLLVKYDSSGTPQWAATTTSGAGASAFASVAVDSAGNVFAAGEVTGTGGQGLGNGTTALGSDTGTNVVLVKYSAGGLAQWARSVTAATAASAYAAVAVDPNGNLLTAGSIFGAATFAAGVSATGTFAGRNLVLVKYNTSGTAQWASTTAAGTAISGFNSVATDSSGNAYAAGLITANAAFGLGNGTSVTGPFAGGSNMLVAKYDPTGNAVWAQSVTVGPSSSTLSAVAVDPWGSVYTTGSINAAGSYTFGGSTTASGAFAGGTNAVVVKY